MIGEPQYLLVIYRAEKEAEPPVSPGHIADALDRSPAAATEMLQRLESRGLVTYEPYQGATLTDEGRATAADLNETYQILLRFFRDVLDLDDCEAEARQLTGTVSPTVADRLASSLLGDAGAARENEPASPSDG
ncbi:metal-dependent transcriptional regulator [Haloarcula salina]|uniref:Metal-dependent transcriptional regulator n=1 Tax=Haloarcula salina TaxID=1429914 RepID=A0AA41FYX7_9EURY|nr:metal-dependent transcriptional regulator [Haloarcula salina]MBV0901340.1 metal-dependent transcriptional regulator [Haloarcula salina]